MSIAEKLQTIAENEQRVYDAGKEAALDAFFEAYQMHGEPMVTDFLFSHARWPQDIYKPKYTIRSSGAAMYATFYSTHLTDTVVEIDGRSKYLNQTFFLAQNLETIRKLYLDESSTFSSAFNWCTVLKNLTIDGTIAQNGFGLQHSHVLSRESITSIINALSATTSGLSITLSKTAVKAAFSTDEWNALAATKSNWTISLA